MINITKVMLISAHFLYLRRLPDVEFRFGPLGTMRPSDSCLAHG